jgi:hypothetical protein
LALIYLNGALAPGVGKAAMLARTLFPLVMFWLPIIVIAARRRTWEDYGLTWTNWSGHLARGLLIALAVLPPFVLGYDFFWGLLLGGKISLHFGVFLLAQAPTQLLAVALPEEVFFRGYLQTLFTYTWRTKKSWPLFGDEAPAIVATALVFALAHYAAHFDPLRWSVFFPGLLFGIMRARSGSIIPAIVVHTLANLTMIILEGGV